MNFIAKKVVKNSNDEMNDKSDIEYLQKVLRDQDVVNWLSDLTTMARRSSAKHHRGDYYEAYTPAFCDGFEIQLGEVRKEAVVATKAVMKNSIQSRLKDMIIRNILVL